METRQIIAYLMILALVACFSALGLYLTRERRAHHRAYRRWERDRMKAQPQR